MLPRVVYEFVIRKMVQSLEILERSNGEGNRDYKTHDFQIFCTLQVPEKINNLAYKLLK